MRKKIFILSVIMIFNFFCANAGPGDTTWVQAQNNIQLNYYNNFDTAINFPDAAKSYGKIIMIFTLGKYQCPVGSQYCGDWDYTIQNFLLTPTDTLELSRLITPYADATAPRTGWNWTQRYYFDVTDFYPLLKNKRTIRLLYSGYSGGFTANIKFAFIEGTPPRDVVRIDPLWNGSFTYGDTANPIDNNFKPINLTMPDSAKQAAMKFTVTGHGSDNNYCCEFRRHYYKVFSNNSLLDQTDIWRDDCGSNELYPQSGTWIYNRANWCPGDLINPDVHTIPNVNANGKVNVKVKFQDYTGSGSLGEYTVESAMFFYGAFNHNLDASIEDIISPSNYEGYFRENPICGSPVIKIRNAGATVINSISFQYGVQGQQLQTYTLQNISLQPLVDTTISLPELTILNSIAAGTYQFVATIKNVNGAPDTYKINNSYSTTFINAPLWPSQFAVNLKTNKQADNTKWYIQDMQGNIVAQQNPTEKKTLYQDTVSNLATGCYQLVVTDAGCNGLYWWAEPGAGKGYINVSNTDGTLLPLSNNLPPLPSIYAEDFGCGFIQNFRVNSILPLSLISFTGKAAGNVNDLFWETANEINTDYFGIEYSINGANFSQVNTVPAKGNTIGKTNYSVTHVPPQKENVYYYRLRMVDLDGTFRYSNVVTIIPSLQTTAIQVMPDPFTDMVQIIMLSETLQTAAVNIYDINGHLVKNENFNVQQGVNNIKLTGLNNLAKGMYLIKINYGDQEFKQTLIKAN